MKLAWLTDIHLNFLEKEKRKNFYQSILDSSCDAVLISGDIAEAPCMFNLLTEMSNSVEKPIYFVLGNHDYYNGSVEKVRADLIQLLQTTKLLYWMPKSGAQLLTPDVVLVGTDGFADARYGDYERSAVRLNDSNYIVEFRQEALCSRKNLQIKMQEFADQDAQQLEQDIETAIDKHKPKKIIVITHVPPFPEVCLHRGNPTDKNFLPFYASKATGDVLLKMTTNYPLIDFSVLCGHTHGYAHSQIMENLCVTAGESEYYMPSVQKIIDLKIC